MKLPTVKLFHSQDLRFGHHDLPDPLKMIIPYDPDFPSPLSRLVTKAKNDSK